VRRLSGLVAVGAVVAATAVTARTGGSTGATAVDTIAETAWLPDAGGQRMLLADALSGRAVTAVEAPGLGPAAPAQAGTSAVSAGPDRMVVVSGRTWRATGVDTSPSAGAFAVAGPHHAWLVSPRQDTARPVDIDGELGRLGDPAPAGRGLGPDRVRVTDDGTLWALGTDELRAVADGGPPRVLALDPGGYADRVPPERALTLVDGDPVVVEAHRARHVDRATATFDREWPVDLPDGPIAAAERSEGVAVARVGRRLSVTGPGRPAVRVDLDPDAGGIPVALRGRVYLPDDRTNEVVVVDPGTDPAARPVVSRISVPGHGDLRLFAHHRHVWYLRHGPDPDRDGAGVIAGDGTARPIDVSGLSAPGLSDRGRPTRGGMLTGDDAAPSGGRGRPPASPALDPQTTPCARTWSSARCLPDGPPQPGARTGPGPSPAACPLTWPSHACLTAAPPGAGPPGADAGSRGSAPAVDFTWQPLSPARGQDVVFTLAGPAAAPGAAHWGFAGTTPASATGTTATARWVETGRYQVTVTVDGSGAPVVHDVQVGGLPDTRFLPVADAATALERAGLRLGEPRPVPALQPPGTVVAVRYQNHPIGPGDTVPPGATVSLDVADGSKPVVAVAGSTDHTCVLTLDARVYCWGLNEHGQLGDGGLENSATPVLVDGLDHVIAIAAGLAVSCALLADHSVACWGDNQYGAIGDGTDGDRARPTAVENLHDAQEVVTTGSVSCARRADRTVWCWGNGAATPGLLGPAHDGVALVPVPVGISGATHLSATAIHTCATLADGTARCWGVNGMGSLGTGDEEMTQDLVTVVDLADAAAVEAGYFFTCARHAAGTVSCWGFNIYGQVGNGSSGDSELRPVPVVGLRDVQQLSSGFAHSCARVGDGTIRCWGYGYFGGLGDGTTSDSTVPRPVPGITTAVAVTVAGYHTCAILDDGSLHCWGLDDRGQPGSPETNFLAPTRIRVGGS
jgi:alpha-tubulin suppressor-like RCC1 family protein